MKIYFVDYNITGSGGGYISRDLLIHNLKKQKILIVDNPTDADIIHGYGVTTFIKTAKLSKKYKIPSVLNLNGITFSPSMSYYRYSKNISPRYYRNKLLLKKYSKYINAFATLNLFFYENWVNDGIPHKKIKIINNMIDDTFKSLPQSNSHNLRILFIGEKSHYRQDNLARKLIQNLKRQHQLNFTQIYGGVEYKKMPLIYSKNDIYIQPMKFPICTTRTLIESMSSGLCPVIYGCQKYSPIVIDGKNGLLVSKPDRYRWWDALNTLCGNPDLVYNLGKQASIDIKIVCDPELITKKYISIYESLYGIKL